MKMLLAKLAVKYLMPEIRIVKGYPDPRKHTVKEYVHVVCNMVADWNNKDAALYLSEWLDEYLDNYLED